MSETTVNAKTGRVLGVLGNLKIKTKVFLGFLGVLAILAVVSGLGYTSFARVGEALGVLEHQVRVTELALEIDREFLDVRRNAREFAAGGAEEAAKATEAAAADVEKPIAEGLEIFTQPELRQKLEELEASFQGYRANFARVVALKEEEAKLIAESLDPTGAKLADGFKAVQAAAAAAGNSNAAILAGASLQSLMEVRLYANKAIGGNDKGLVGKLDHAREQLEEEIGRAHV